MIDIQIYNQGKKTFWRSNITWFEAHQWLNEKEAKGKEIDCIDIQLFTTQGMPVDSIDDLKTFQEAHDWIELMLHNYKTGQFIELGVY